VVLDHEKEGLKGMATICGGKLTTYREAAALLYRMELEFDR